MELADVLQQHLHSEQYTDYLNSGRQNAKPVSASLSFLVYQNLLNE